MTATLCPRCGAHFPEDYSSAGLCPACLLATALAPDSDPTDSVDAWPHSLPSGSTIDSFRIRGLLGRGGMAAVYEADDVRLERTIALKVLPPEFANDEAFVRRFEREAKVVARLEHPSIVPIYATGIDGDTPWMSMRLMAGGSLGALLEKGPLDRTHALSLLRQVADALDYAHAHGVLHRDIKPSNILLDADGRACVADFGLAQLLEVDDRATRTGALVGTPHYMSPERALGQRVDHRSDIYSLGIVAYELFVGHVPFSADSPVTVLLKHVSQPLPEISADELPRPLAETIGKATAKEPAQRWSSAVDFVSALELASSGLLTVESGAHSLWQRARGKPRLFGTVAAALIVSTVFAWWIVVRVPTATPPQPVGAPAGIVEEAAPPEEPPPVQSSDGAPVREPPAPPGLQRPTAPSPVAANVAPRGTEPVAVPKETLEPPRPLVESQQLPVGFSGQPVSFEPSAPDEPADESSPPEPAQIEAQQAVAAQPEVEEIVSARRTKTVTPDYPAAARAAQLEGDVLLRAVVGTDGTVGDVTVMRSVHPLLDDAARSAVMQYEYTPALRNGVPTSTTVDILVSFRLQ